MKKLLGVLALGLAGCQVEVTDARRLEECRQADLSLERAIYAVATDVVEIREKIGMPPGLTRKGESKPEQVK